MILVSMESFSTPFNVTVVEFVSLVAPAPPAHVDVLIINIPSCSMVILLLFVDPLLVPVVASFAKTEALS